MSDETYEECGRFDMTPANPFCLPEMLTEHLGHDDHGNSVYLVTLVDQRDPDASVSMLDWEVYP